jgi:hypothetical protein
MTQLKVLIQTPFFGVFENLKEGMDYWLHQKKKNELNLPK